MTTPIHTEIQNDTEDGLKGLLTTAELAKLLHISKATVLRYAASGRLPAVRLGKLIRFNPAKIADWLRSKEADKEG